MMNKIKNLFNGDFKKYLGIGLVVALVAGLFWMFYIIKMDVSDEDVVKFDQPLPYESSSVNVLNEAEFEVFQVFSDCALARDESDWSVVVVLVGEDYYDYQEVKVHNPMRVGAYSYKARSGERKTVPIVMSGDE